MIKYTCKYCNQNFVRKAFLEDHILHCFQNTDFEISKYTINDKIDFTDEKNFESLKSIPYSQKDTKQYKAIFICKKCKKQQELTLFNFLFSPFLCTKCKKEETFMKKYGVSNPSKLETVKQKKKETSLTHFGTEFPLQNKEVVNKRKQNCLKKYGVDSTSKLDSMQEKRKQNCLEKYGVDHIAKTDQHKAKVKQTCLVKYGVENYRQSKEFKSQAKATKLAKYNNENFNNREKAKATCNELYKADYPMQNTQVKEKMKSTNLSRYGSTCSLNNPVVKEKCKKTLLKKYGVEYFSQSPLASLTRKTHIVYDEFSFDSFTELCFYLYCKDNGMKIERCSESFNYMYENTEHTYIPDFKVNEDFYEIKGNQFLKEDGTWQNPYDHSLDDLYEAKHQCALKNNVKILYQSDCESYIKYVNNVYKNLKEEIYGKKDV